MADDKTQLDKFKDAARELECDNDDQRFRERVGKLAKAKPSGDLPTHADDARNRSAR